MYGIGILFQFNSNFVAIAENLQIQIQDSKENCMILIFREENNKFELPLNRQNIKNLMMCKD